MNRKLSILITVAVALSLSTYLVPASPRQPLAGCNTRKHPDEPAYIEKRGFPIPWGDIRYCEEWPDTLQGNINPLLFALNSGLAFVGLTAIDRGLQQLRANRQRR